MHRLVAIARWLCALSIAALISSFLGTGSVEAASVGEQKLKAAFLYNFTKFIEWRTERFANASDPVVIGLMADASMLAEVTSMAADKQVNGRTVVVRKIETPADLEAAHVVYVDLEEQTRFVSLRKRARSIEALVVGDGDDCSSSDGAICFVQQGDKLRFEVNAMTAERAHVKISAQLQKLALAVHRGT